MTARPLTEQETVWTRGYISRLEERAAGARERGLPGYAAVLDGHASRERADLAAREAQARPGRPRDTRTAPARTGRTTR